jgi:OmpA-OmpF porin, OOP family
MKTVSMLLIAGLSVLLFVMGGCGSGKTVTDTALTREQQNIRAQLFEDIDVKLEEVKAMHGDLYSPKHFETAMRHYQNAERLLRTGRSIEEMRAEINRASAAFNRAAETTRLGVVTFSTTIAARNDALTADAPVFAPERWKTAEATFRSAAESLEDGTVNRARQQAQVAENQYRSVELEAIKANYLNDARETLRVATAERAERNAPKTLSRAQSLVRQVETLLQQDRYDTEEAGRLAMEAAYEASHALHLHRTITRMQNERKTFEDVYLEAENTIREIADAVDLEVRFDSGFDAPAESIIAVLNEKMEAERALADKVRQQNEEIAQLRNQIEEKGDLAGLLETQRRREEAINSVIDLFSPEEGNVFLDGNDVLIRLYGLSFPVGRSTIEPQYFELLRRVQDAIKRFPNSRVAIEGHTDSRGSLELNKRLSEERADAVAEYIRANIGIPLDMTAAGYGPDRPVASNETEEGRARNRRIDVVITPDWALGSR